MLSFYFCCTWSICCVTCNVMHHLCFTLSISCLLSCSMLSFYVCGTVCVLHSVHLLSYWYSQLSANRHSRKQTADYIQTLFSFPAITSQSNSVLTHPCKRTQTLLKVELGFFSFALSQADTPRSYHCIYLLTKIVFILNVNQLKSDLRQSNRSVGIGFLKRSVRLTWHQARVSAAIFGHLLKHN